MEGNSRLWLAFSKEQGFKPKACSQNILKVMELQSVRTGVIPWDASIENCVQNLNLSHSGGLPTITGDELWRQHGPQTLRQAFEFTGRVVKVQAEGKTLLKKAVQQALINIKHISGLTLTLNHPDMAQ